MRNNGYNGSFLGNDSVVSAESYRKPMLIKKVLIINATEHDLGYYICPRCNVSMEREFTSFCDRCGQALDWRTYKKAERVYKIDYGQN